MCAVISKFRIYLQCILVIFVCIFVCGIIYAADSMEQARILAEQDKYKEAYEILRTYTQELSAEAENLRGLVDYYKKELNAKSQPQRSIDYAYNAAANTLWASAWDLQHDAIFKKTGREKIDFLEKAASTYKRIVIDYPDSNKAEEAQFQTGKLYYKFLKDNSRAELELQKYINIYPNGRYASEANEMLMRIRKK